MTPTEVEKARCHEAWIHNRKLWDSIWAEEYANQKLARATCALCPVQAECLEAGLEEPDTLGVWGGTGRRDRQEILTSRRMVTRAVEEGWLASPVEGLAPVTMLSKDGHEDVLIPDAGVKDRAALKQLKIALGQRKADS